MTLELDGLGNEQFHHAQIASTLSSRTQQLIILPTERCNFRCTYCYEDFLIGKMKEPVQLSIERFMGRRIPELSELSIHWFGGEPLLAKQVVLRLSARASELCDEHGVSLIGGLTTNAYVLTPDLFEELLTYNQRFFQITFDGWQEGHDAVRKMANGRGSFGRIWENVCATKHSPSQFKIQIRIHVRRDNHENLEILLSNLAREFGGDPRYSLDFEHLRNLGGPGGKSVDRPLSLTELREVEKRLRSGFELAVASLDLRPSALDRPGSPIRSAPIGEVQSSQLPDAPPYICYASKPNSLLIRADGRIGKCTVALDDERNTIGRINADGTVSIDNERLRPWVRGLADLNSQSLSCPLAGLPPAPSQSPRRALNIQLKRGIGTMETNKNIRLDELSLDNLGRVILSDAIIEQLEKCENLLFSGGANLNCGGSANGGCSNARCDGSLNGSCTNSMSCTSAANMLACQNPDDGVPVNRSCV